MTNCFFITGYVRSGTTLVEKLLCNHPSLSVLSQPLPTLYFELKRLFLNSIDINNEYFLLSHYVGEKRYRPIDFQQYLNLAKVPAEIVDSSINSSYSGNWTSVARGELKSSLSLDMLYQHLMLANTHNPMANMFGSKEVLCEEFVPYYLTHGIKVLHITRDPRDVVSSIKRGNGNNFIGQVKPLLFELRNWRKSAQLAIQYKNTANFMSIKYEDLVLDTDNVLKAVCNFLDIEVFPNDAFSNGILTQSGKVWSSNSSFSAVDGLVSSGSIGKYKELLSKEVLEYIAVICHPELHDLSMQSLLDPNFSAIIKNFQEPIAVTDNNSAPDYSTNAGAIEYEIVRLHKFLDGNLQFEFLVDKH
ncbi:MAG: hypothetical protein ACI9LX_002593 [Paraglaciecola sp.]|jgi:hypothetical protein